MLTLFACPKPFHAEMGPIQRNAVRSWLLLRPKPRVILFGNDHGTGAIAAELGVDHVPDVKRNDYGTPLVSDLFTQARRLSDSKLLCYVNSDIILPGSLIRAVRMLQSYPPPFLGVGRCWNLDVDGELDFEGGAWEAELEQRVRREGRLRGPFSIDYCVFTPGLFDGMPPFAVGRIRWDNWLVWRARRQGGSVIDVGQVVRPIHQTHQYGHVPGGQRWSYRGPEARLNRRLAGFGRTLHVHGILDATHGLTEDGIQRRSAPFPFVRQIGLRTFFWLRERWNRWKNLSTSTPF